MTTTKVQEAIAFIKAGDRAAAREMLTEVLREDPNNETAWLWLSALVTGERRRFCLEKVLSINPDHVQAREQLAKLSPPPPPAEEPAPEPAPAEVHAPSIESLQPVTVTAPEPRHLAAQEVEKPQVWLTPGKRMSSVLYLLGDVLLAFDVSPEQAQQVLGVISQGVTAAQLESLKQQYALQNIHSVPLRTVREARLSGDTLRITSADRGGNERTISTTVNRENAGPVLSALQGHAGASFERVERPMGRMTALASALALFLVTCCATGGLYLFTQTLAAEARGSGAAPARGLTALLLWIGPNGFLCLGAVLLLLIVIALARSFTRPPETVLRRG